MLKTWMLVEIDWESLRSQVEIQWCLKDPEEEEQFQMKRSACVEWIKKNYI